MKTSWGIFRRDIHRLTESVVSVVVIIGLCLVPSLYAWFNIMSNADPYGPSSTSNIKVAVANEDDGSELVGLKLNIGEMVVEGIQGNDQMGWQFVDTREEALAGVYSGDYYAAIIVPEDFTKDFLSILDGELEHPQVEYYENEKKNAIAPKITSKAKTAVQEQINSTIVESVANVINTISSVMRALGIDMDDVAENMKSSADDACQQIEELTATLYALQNLVDETQNLLDVTTLVVNDAGQVLYDAGSVSQGIGDTTGAIYNAASTANNGFISTLDQIDKNYASLLESLVNWSGDPTSPDSVSAYLNAADSDLASLSGYGFYSDLQSTLSNMSAEIGTLNGYASSINNASVREGFISTSSALQSDMGTLITGLQSAQSASVSAAAQAYDLYSAIAGGADAATVDAQLSALSSAVSAIGLPNTAEEYLAVIDALRAANAMEPRDSAAMLSYALTLYDGLNSLSANLGSAAELVYSAQQNVANAQNEVANYRSGSEYYADTLAMLDSFDASLNSLLDTAPTAAQPMIKLAIANNSLLREGFVKAGGIKTDQETIDLINSIRSTLREAAATVNTSINEKLGDSAERIQSAMNSIQSSLNSGVQTTAGLSLKLQTASSAMGDANLTLGDCIELAGGVHDYLLSLSEDIDKIINSEAFRQLVDILENNPDGLADYLSSPVDMRTVIVYKIDDYGSAMSPYYVMLALFVGSLLTAAMIKPGIAYEEYRLCTPLQHYFGRLLIFLCIGFLQALVTSLGCLYYVHIQCTNNLLFILACVITSFNFVMMNYSLLFALDNVGLAISVIIMVIEIAGSGGSYPIHVLPQVFQDLYPYMPFHYGMDMLRETIGGFYNDTYLRCALILLGMCLIFFAIGIVFYYPAKKLNEMIAKSKAASGIM